MHKNVMLKPICWGRLQNICIRVCNFIEKIKREVENARKQVAFNEESMRVSSY